MAYRQYIGARYVPLFDGNWDATKNYEPLTVVEDGNGNSYTSKKDVPAGTPLTDRNYWIQTSNFSSTVRQLQDRVAEAEHNITDLTDGLQDAKNDITDLKDGLQNVENEISKIDTSVGITAKSKIVFIGDSWTNGNGRNGIDYYLPNLLPTNNIVFKSYGGAGFSSNPTFISLLNQVADDDTVTHVIVAGGVNEPNDPTAIINDGKAFIDRAAEKFPNAKCMIIALNRRLYGTVNRNDYITTYSKLAGYRSVPVYDLSKVVPFSFFTDVLHLSTEGYSILSNVIAGFLLGGGVVMPRGARSIQYTVPQETTQTTRNLSLSTSPNGDNTVVFIPDTAVNVSGLSTNYIEIVPSDIIYPFTSGEGGDCVTLPIGLVTPSGTVYETARLSTMYDGKIRLTWYTNTPPVNITRILLYAYPLHISSR